MNLLPSFSAGGKVSQIQPGSWRLELPAGSANEYRLAQMDDYSKIPRSSFLWKPPVCLRLYAACSSGQIPGTWGFGFWNDPFSFSLGFRGGIRRLPALPNCAWFFFASPPNYLSLIERIPAFGYLAATFQSPTLPPMLLWLCAPLLPLAAFPAGGRLLRSIARKIISQDAILVNINPLDWHDYRLEWGLDKVNFFVDEKMVFTTRVVPNPPASCVIWIDNQYASLPPNGRLRYGTLANPKPAWIDIRDVTIQSTAI